MICVIIGKSDIHLTLPQSIRYLPIKTLLTNTPSSIYHDHPSFNDNTNKPPNPLFIRPPYNSSQNGTHANSCVFLSRLPHHVGFSKSIPINVTWFSKVLSFTWNIITLTQNPFVKNIGRYIGCKLDNFDFKANSNFTWYCVI